MNKRTEIFEKRHLEAGHDIRVCQMKVFRQRSGKLVAQYMLI